MELTSANSIREQTRRQIFSILDEQGKASLVKKMEAEKREWRANEETKKGNARIKMEIDRIKETAPKKTLQAFLQLQTVLMNHEDSIPGEVMDEINDIIANPDDSLNLFSCMTDMMAVCDYEETAIVKEKKWTTHQAKTMGERLTEADKLIRANDPEDKTMMMCPLCKRTMTPAWYIKSHRGTHVCQRAVEAQALCLKEKKVFSLDMGKDLAKLQVQSCDEVNASLGDIVTGLGNLNIGAVVMGADLSQ
tara:strand:+ start:2309 stop:3055 length:747 start_codon:yes stop_codon:yes gene_type:complete